MGTGVSPTPKPNGIKEDIAEIKQSLKCLEKMVGEFRVEYAREHQRVVNEAQMALELARLNQKEIAEIKEQIAPLITWAKIVGGIGAILIGLIVTLLWNLAIGNWTIVSP